MPHPTPIDPTRPLLFFLPAWGCPSGPDQPLDSLVLFLTACFSVNQRSCVASSLGPVPLNMTLRWGNVPSASRFDLQGSPLEMASVLRVDWLSPYVPWYLALTATLPPDPDGSEGPDGAGTAAPAAIGPGTLRAALDSPAPAATPSPPPGPPPAPPPSNGSELVLLQWALEACPMGCYEQAGHAGPGICRCLGNYSGPLCGCPFDCYADARHGVCAHSDECHCTPPYSGPWCESRPVEPWNPAPVIIASSAVGLALGVVVILGAVAENYDAGWWRETPQPGGGIRDYARPASRAPAGGTGSPILDDHIGETVGLLADDDQEQLVYNGY
ncbi:hypothetical protein PAPYR_3016 [Paratrimastix pyriformis]|uniref:EGF-like domain-containing protein n=1 Tax=Paratrimastix pyriformis TaxID=342808 RepID=A0ABQ8URR3_9EUKA|nr:hypothetical protein PAPYR_3016 [Paratrimastix pyriformis]